MTKPPVLTELTDTQRECSAVQRAELRQRLAAVAREFGISRETLSQYLQTAG
jgi:transposase-like protein